MNLRMISNYFKITWRSLTKNPVYSCITIFGLALGLACCFIIFLFLSNEMSYDAFHEKSERIYRVNYKALFSGDNEFAASPPAMAPVLPGFFPEIEVSARLYKRDATVSRTDSPDIQFEETDIFFADSTLTRIFTFKTLYGSIDEALRSPGVLAISHEIAEKYFGTINAVGETLTLEGGHPFLVAAVFEAYPELSHISINMLSAYDSMYLFETKGLRDILAGNWVGSHSYTYVLLRENAIPESINNRFADFVEHYVPERFHGGIEFYLIPLEDIYLHSNAFMEPGPMGSMTNIYIFSIVAFLILVVACINYVNLSTARSLKRTLEVGVRKALGAHRKHLIAQFLCESFLLSMLALMAAFLMVEIMLPFVNQVVKTNLVLSEALQSFTLSVFILITIIAGLGAGIYPALYASAFDPVSILKGEVSSASKRGDYIRKMLLIGQFAVTIILISGAYVVYQQLSYMQNQPMGFQQENIIYSRFFFR
jgi:putative ABC transport system permease protein